MIQWQELIAIVAEAILALVATFVSIRQTMQRVKSDRDQNALTSLLLCVPRAVLMAECVFGESHGSEKFEYALLILQKYAASLGLDYAKYDQVCRDAIEDVLQTPQKKLEDLFYDQKKDE